MVQDALALWKKIKAKGERGTTLYLRLFVFFAFFVVALVLAFLLILNIAGVFHIGIHKSQAWFENELEHLSQDISNDYGNLSVHGVNLSEKISKSMESYLKEARVAPSGLADHPELLEELLSLQMPDLLSALQNNKCGGAFLILDASVIPQAHMRQRAGLFLKRTEPNTVGTMGSKLHCLRGPANIARENSIELLGQWQMEFTGSETDFFSLAVETSRKRSELPLSRLYYWSPRRLLSGNSEAGMLLSVPLITSDGTVLGICGFEVSSMLFKQSYSPDNSVYARVFSVLAPVKESGLHMDGGLLAGNSYLNSALGGNIAVISEEDAPFNRYRSGEQGDYSGVQRTVRLYPAGSPYQEDIWAAAVMAPREDMQVAARKGILGLQLGIGVLCLLSLLAAAFVSRRYILPVLKTLEGIKNGSGYAALPKTQYQEINDLLEFLAAQDEAVSAALAEAKTGKTPASVGTERENLKPPDLDPEQYQRFLKCLETLSPAERRVFDLYVREYRAKDIAAELHLSMNTVKYHNGNIYGKLEVGSRKELLSYIRFMHCQQKREEEEHDEHLS